ncbi:velvet factor domain-containing protein [Hirsutella rhossiliensis]|uniref:Velvet factor domain-containing protein n=1 Tax=Hirsutella rhossiliensis TaxID=111463 RepID=A0A9P8MSU7_9HYPO|nr:velvet factor domain-containing protein [Hirsutella rhossiliensis]KAH0960655.1 velvet factor domain-containing protein [Hirsutella rhossiliensis]
MNSTHPPPDQMRSAYPPSPANPGSAPAAAPVYLNSTFQHHHHQHQPPPRQPQSSPHDMHRLNVLGSPHGHSQPHLHPHPHASPPPLSQPPPSHIHHSQLQHHNMMPPPPHMQPPPPPPPPSSANASRPDDAPSTSSMSSANSQGSSQTMLAPFSKVDEATGRKYQLDVVQQPRRARMCGFGDKDRRPITPPPCVRLIITDAATGREIDCNAIDHSMFVLNVDLWNEDGTREVNLVRSSTGSPSISSTTPYSYTTLNGGDTSMVPYTQHILPSNRDAAFNSPQSVGFVHDYQVQPGYGQAPPSYPSNGTYGPPQQFYPQHQAYRQDGAVPPVPSQANMAHFTRNGVPVAPGFVQDQNSLTRMAMVGGQPQGMFTRNLIGSLAASAFRLSDTSDHIGIWFVLQDLSVRTEGAFRLRFSFVNVGARGGARRDGNVPRVNTGRAPILASCFSDVFNVYSAKKFPGVCESTPLSKTFATQGIKIPIRKDANVKGGDDDDYGE